ncbi:MAG: AI-2E family transporter [Phycisphaerales bacterium]|nr:AI-2E family transporter [Phycisphaerales bacterium]
MATPEHGDSSGCSASKCDCASTPKAAPAAPNLHKLHLWQIQGIRDILVVGLVVAILYLGYQMRTVTVPLLVALTLAYLVEPVVGYLCTFRFVSRPVAVSLIVFVSALALSITLAIGLPLVIGQGVELLEGARSGRYDNALSSAVESLPKQYRQTVTDLLERFGHPLGLDPVASTTATDVKPPSTTSTFVGEVAAGFSTLELPWVSLLGSSASQLLAFALAVLRISLVTFLIPFYFWFFSVSFPTVVEFFKELVPDEKKDLVFSAVRDMDRAVAGFVRGRIVICFCMGVGFAIGWHLCGVPYAIALGALTGALSIVPYLGGIGVPAAIGMLFIAQFEMPVEQRMGLIAIVIWPTVVFTIVQSIEGYILTPIIAGKATNLDPVTIVVAILAGGSIAGIYGMLLAIPAAACGKIAIQRQVLPRLKDWARGRVADPLPIKND